MQNRYHELKLTYPEFLNMNRSIAHCQIENYYVYQQFDRGTYGSIYLGMDDRTKKIIAIKLLDLEEINKEKFEKVRQIRKRLSISEPQLMMLCDSENIVKCYDVYYNESLKIMMLQYCNGTNLQKEIELLTRFPENEAILVIKQIINGVAEMHKKRIMHRDLKPDNILKHNGVYKIADFGFSKLAVSQEDVGQTTLGTITTMAPEVMGKQPYGTKADIWSIGVIFFLMVYGKLPYDSKTANKMFQEIKTKRILDTQRFSYNDYTASKEVTSFLKQILVIEPENRLNWSELQAHPLLKDSDRLEAKFCIRSSFKPQQVQLENYDVNKTLNQILAISDKDEAQESPRSIKNVTESQVKEKKLEVEKSKRFEQELYKWVQQCHFECLKTELIYFEIVEKIIQNELYDISQRQVIELLYLLLTRGMNNIGVINVKLQQSEDFIVQNLKESVAILYSKVTSCRNNFCNKLTEEENKVSSIIFDRISRIFKTQSINEKDLYLVEVEGIDYDKESQIEFTYRVYISDLIDRMNASSGTNINFIKNLMKYYVKINMTTLKDLQDSKLTFLQYIQKYIFI